MDKSAQLDIGTVVTIEGELVGVVREQINNDTDFPTYRVILESGIEIRAYADELEVIPEVKPHPRRRIAPALPEAPRQRPGRTPAHRASETGA